MKAITRLGAVAILAVVSSTGLHAQSSRSCTNGRLVADFGYEFVSCVGCLSITLVGQREYTRFLDTPLLHKIRPDGPGAGKLIDRDTLVRVGGHDVTSIEAAKLLSDWQLEPVELVVRRNGRLYTFAVAAAPICTSDRPFRSQLPRPRRPRLGVALECKGCRSETLPGDKERWVHLSPPALTEVVPGGPAARAGLRAGDTLTAIDNFPITGREAGERLGAIEPGRPMRWTVRRDGRLRSVTIIPDRE